MPTSRDVLDFVFDTVNNVLNVKLAANSGVDIGDVDVTSIAAGDNNIGNVDVLTIAAGDNNIGNVDIASMPINSTVSGVIDAAAETVTLTLPGGASAVGLQVTGTWVGQLEFEGTIDGTNYTSVEASNGTATVNATAGNDIFILPGGGYLKVRTRASAWTSGSATVTFVASVGTAANILTGAIPAGANLIGKVGIDQATANANEVVVKSGTITTLTTLTGITNALPAGTNNIGDVDVLSIAAGSNTIGGTTDAGIASTSVLTYTASADMTTAAAISAAPTGSQKIVVDDIIFSSDTAMWFEFEEETSGTVFAKVFVPANGTVMITPRGKFKLATADKKLFGDASVAGNVAITTICHSEA